MIKRLTHLYRTFRTTNGNFQRGRGRTKVLLFYNINLLVVIEFVLN
jgi:hypothetical protein